VSARDVHLSSPSPGAGLGVFMDMLSFRRPAWSTTEEAFISRFLRPLEGMEEDAFGNLLLCIAGPGGETPHILWSSHTDTVHRAPGRQSVLRQGTMAVLRDTSEGRGGASNCLGADCASGVWLMREMILARVPGLYVFHRDEENGGHGSAWIASNTPERLENIRFAIALDRRGYSDVITHQGGRTASDAFAASLAGILGARFQPDDTGLFTDTAMYAGLVGECTNVSVGYFNAHGPREQQDLVFLAWLRDTLVSADFSGLTAERAPGAPEDDLWGLDWRWEESTAAPILESLDADSSFVRSHPEIVADFLETCGVTMADLRAHAGYFDFC
jgi:hypothetical protein